MRTGNSAGLQRAALKRRLDSVNLDVRAALCTGIEGPEVRARHVAACLAFSPVLHSAANEMRIGVVDASTAAWLVGALAHRDVGLAEDGDFGGVVVVSHPRQVLAPYGWRDGRWAFGQGMDAALGISRGAVHAGARFTTRGVKVACPDAPMMLTLTAVMGRLGIAAKPNTRPFRVVIGAVDVPDALERIGIGAAVIDAHQHVKDDLGGAA